MNWKNLLQSTSESVNDDLRLRNAYLVAENRILRNQIDGRIQLSNAERQELAKIGAKLGRKALIDVATVAQPDTILAWSRKFAAQPVDTSKPGKSVGRPRVTPELEELVIRLARENRMWGYDRIQGALQHLGYTISDQTVGNILKRHRIPPAPERQKTVTWREFVRYHLDVLMATDFFNSEVWSWVGLSISDLLSFIHFNRHQVQSAMATLHQLTLAMCCPPQSFLKQGLRAPKFAHLSNLLSQVGRSGEGGREQQLSEDRFGDVYLPQSGEAGKVMDLSAVHIRQIRGGPIRSPVGKLLNNCNREAA